MASGKTVERIYTKTEDEGETALSAAPHPVDQVETVVDLPFEATWNALIIGALIVAFAIAELMRFREWEEWFGMVFGLWLIVSPWVLGFAQMSGSGTAYTATWNMVIVGVLTAGFSAWSLYDHRDQEMAG